MDHKVWQATGLGVLVRVGRSSRLVGSIFSLTLRSTAGYRAVPLPPPNSELTLSKSSPTPKVQRLVGFEGVAQHSFEDLCNDCLLQSLATAPPCTGNLLSYWSRGKGLRGGRVEV